ncbi:glycosyltransferase family 4 protein [Sphingomonas sp. ST-64]|uniref:Glycosyltransferase family 4 protein n=1 Tax=Sphingomonas plantiphila TaxID=3163295 RepID=A0ABW8YKX9_9SPHN
MNLVFVIGSLDMGGAQRVALNLIGAWRKRGWAVTLVVTFSGRGSSYYDIPEGVEVVYLADLVGERTRGALARMLALRRLLKAKCPDRVVSFLTNANVIALGAARGLRLSVIVSERNYPPADVLPRRYALVRRFIYPLASRVVMQTNRGGEWLSRTILLARGVTIPNPVALPLPVTVPRLDPGTVVGVETRLLLGVGRLAAQKGFDVMIEAFRQVADEHRDWQLVIVGDGDERAALERQVAQAGLIDRVHLVGAAGNMGDWYTRADIFAMTSRFEGFPNALLEAMAHGCAVISFDCDTGPADMIDQGRNGVLLGAAPDAAELAGALSALMTDESRRVALADAARAVLDRFSMDTVLAQWDAALNIDSRRQEGACAA